MQRVSGEPRLSKGRGGWDPLFVLQADEVVERLGLAHKRMQPLRLHVHDVHGEVSPEDAAGGKESSSATDAGGKGYDDRRT